MAGVQGIWSGITESGVAEAGIVCSGIAGSGVAPTLPNQALLRRCRFRHCLFRRCLPETDRLDGLTCPPDRTRPRVVIRTDMAARPETAPRKWPVSRLSARGMPEVSPRSGRGLSNVWPRSARQLPDQKCPPGGVRSEVVRPEMSGRLSVIRLSGPGRQAGWPRPAGDCRNIHQKGWRPLPAAAPHTPGRKRPSSCRTAPGFHLQSGSPP